MKSYRINFDKGVNVIGDKALLPDGFASILDNVDLRSGFPRPFKKPEFQFTVPNDTTCSWSYRGKWFHSADVREYAGEYIGGIQRVYQFQDGKYPKKIINDTAVQLGLDRPSSILAVKSSANLVPGNLTATVSYAGKGNLSDGKRVYTICATTDDGTMPTSGIVSVNIADTNHAGASVELSWNPVDKAKTYILFEGGDNEQYRLAELPPNQLSYVDNGSVTPAGDIASQYKQAQSFQYAYSFKRDVNGVKDESGLSYPSLESTGQYGRLITRDFANDGFFSLLDENDNPLVAVSTTSTFVSNPASKSLSGVVVAYNNVLRQTTFAVTAHGLSTGDEITFTMGDPAWNGRTFSIIKVSADEFAIKDMNIPSDAVLDGSDYKLPSTASYGANKTIINYTFDDELYLPIYDADAVVVTVSGVDTLCKATVISTTTSGGQISIPVRISTDPSSLKWIPHNGYVTKWCLYRNEQSGWFLVDEVDIWKSTYEDAKPFSALGGPPSSFYEDAGLTVDYAKPPIGLRSPVLHYGMLFGIDGHKVRWTPVLQPDAWPDVYSVTLPYLPVKIEAFSQGLIILCQDAIYRLDGNSPGGMSLSKTQAEDGCSAPFSVQKTDRGLVYLAKRGVMVFNGTHAECVTDTRVKPETIAGPSTINPSYPFWWMPTLMTRNYADLAGEDKIIAKDYQFTLDNTNVIEGYNNHIKSMYWNGRYFLIYTGDDYMANTVFMVDFQMPGAPITTLGMKILDAHVDEYEQPFILAANSDADDSTAWNKFYGAEALLTVTPQTGKTGKAIHKFNGSNVSRVPLHIRTGQNALGIPTERKRLRQIEFHGTGTVYCRVYVDGQWVIDATATMVEGPAKDRRVGIPIGTRGYFVDVEFCGDADIRAMEFSFDQMSSPS